jgi:APA family basic amino acid/polyamine antiporter
MGFSLGIFPILTVMGVFKLRRDNSTALKLAGFPFTQMIYVITGVLILFLSFLERPAESSVALLTVAAGIPAYYFFRRAGVRSGTLPSSEL